MLITAFYAGAGGDGGAYVGGDDGGGAENA